MLWGFCVSRVFAEAASPGTRASGESGMPPSMAIGGGSSESQSESWSLGAHCLKNLIPPIPQGEKLCGIFGTTMHKKPALREGPAEAGVHLFLLKTAQPHKTLFGLCHRMHTEPCALRVAALAALASRVTSPHDCL